MANLTTTDKTVSEDINNNDNDNNNNNNNNNINNPSKSPSHPEDKGNPSEDDSSTTSLTKDSKIDSSNLEDKDHPREDVNAPTNIPSKDSAINDLPQNKTETTTSSEDDAPTISPKDSEIDSSHPEKNDHLNKDIDGNDVPSKDSSLGSSQQKNTIDETPSGNDTSLTTIPSDGSDASRDHVAIVKESATSHPDNTTADDQIDNNNNANQASPMNADLQVDGSEGDQNDNISQGETENSNSKRKSPHGASGAECDTQQSSKMRKKEKNKEWETFVKKNLCDELKKLMGGYWASEDTERYLNCYPGEKDSKDKKENYLFYTGKRSSSPQGDDIDTIHSDWRERFSLLESHHGYIQWLFPIREQGLNSAAHKLMKHEIESLTSKYQHDQFINRLIKSYSLMLYFYGMDLDLSSEGKVIKRTEKFRDRYDNLNHSFHNYLRITRILKCLGEFGLEKYQAPFVKFILSEIFENGELKNTLKSCLGYWGKVIKDVEERIEVYKLADQYFRTDMKNKGDTVRRALSRFY